MNPQDELKKASARAAIQYIVPGKIIGVGTGSTVNFFIDELAQFKNDILGTVASSEASQARLVSHGIKVFDLNGINQNDMPVYIDGADEIDMNFCMIKGGGGALTREKIVAEMALRFICIADKSKQVKKLGRYPLPVEIVPMARQLVTRTLERLGGRVFLRAGFTTDNGGQILDVHDLVIDDPRAMENVINQIPGVICNGLFAQRCADVLLLSDEHGVATLLPS